MKAGYWQWRVVALAVAAGCWCGARTEAAVKLTLAQEGQPAATIVLAKEASGPARFAAEELRLHFKKITGADLHLATDEESVTGAWILVGESKATSALGLKNSNFKPQEYLIRCVPDALELMGRDPDARAHSVAGVEAHDWPTPAEVVFPDLPALWRSPTCHEIVS